jgi:hypothetical protein
VFAPPLTPSDTVPTYPGRFGTASKASYKNVYATLLQVDFRACTNGYAQDGARTRPSMVQPPTKKKKKDGCNFIMLLCLCLSVRFCFFHPQAVIPGNKAGHDGVGKSKFLWDKESRYRATKKIDF